MADETSSPSRSAAIAALSGGLLTTGGPLVLVVTAMLAVSTLFTPTPRPPDQKPSQTAEEVTEPQVSPEDDDSGDRQPGEVVATMAPLWEHLGINPTVRENESPGLIGLLERRLEKDISGKSEAASYKRPDDPQLQEALDKLDARVLVATLPDPVETGSRYEFDMGLEAIQKSIESEGFLIDHFSNPWGRPGSKPGEPGGSSTAYRRRPACLVFRSGDDESAYKLRRSLLVLFLVGESNSRGIHTEAMRTALSCAGHLSRPDPDGTRAIRILGPTYSGTAADLARCLSEWLAKPENADCSAWICSGSATSVNKKSFERLATPPTPSPRDDQRVIYSSTVFPDEVMLTAVLQHLAAPADHDPSARPDRTVFLVETGTLAGNQFFRLVEKLNQQDVDHSPYTFIPFPRRLAQIRDIPELTQGIDLKLDPKSNDATPLSEKGAMREVFPGFDPKMSEWSDGQILSHVLATISDANARNVGIFASEVRNAITLVKLVNRYCPDAQVFLINNDLLFNYRTLAPDFYGAIVASTYPLDSRAQAWSFPFKGREIRRLFASDTDIGRYNAGVVLLNAATDPDARGELRMRGDAEDMLVYGPPFADLEDRRETVDGARSSRPCVWISVIGKDAAWPLRTLSHETLSAQGKATLSEWFDPRAARHLNLFRKVDPLPEHWASGVPRLAELANAAVAELSITPNERVAGERQYEPGKDVEKEIDRVLKDGDLASVKDLAERLARRDLLRVGEPGQPRKRTARERQEESSKIRDELRQRARNGIAFGLYRLETRIHAQHPGPETVLKDLLNAAFEYWRWALVLEDLDRDFGSRRVVLGENGQRDDLQQFAIQRFEAELIHLGALSPLRPKASDASAVTPDNLAIESSTLSKHLGDLALFLSKDPEKSEKPRDVYPRLYSLTLAYADALRQLLDGLLRLGPNEKTLRLPGPSLHERWRGYRASRQKLDATLRNYFQRRRPAANLEEPAVPILADVKWVDRALAARFRGESYSVEQMIDGLARASELIGQAEKVEKLIPPVLEVNRDYHELIAESLPAAAGPPMRESSLSSILGSIPWSYQAALLGWSILAWIIGLRISYDNLAAPGAASRRLFDFRGDRTRAVWLFSQCLLLILLLVLFRLFLPILRVLPYGREALLLGFLLLGLLVLSGAMRWPASPLDLLIAWLDPADRGQREFLRLVVPTIAAAVFLAAIPCLAMIQQGMNYFVLMALTILAISTLLALTAVQGWHAWGSGFSWINSRGPGPQPSRRWPRLWAVSAIVVLWLGLLPSDGKPAEMLAAARLPYLGSGVSPLPTALCLGTLFLFCFLNRLVQVRSGLALPPRDHFAQLAGGRLGLAPAADALRADEVKRAADELDSLGDALRETAAPSLTRDGCREWLSGISPLQVVMAIVAFLVVFVNVGFTSRLLGRFPPSPEGWTYDQLHLAALYVYLILYLGALSRLHEAWRRLHRLFRTLDALPLQAALHRLPVQVGEAFGRFTGGTWELAPSDDEPIARAQKRYARDVARRLEIGRRSLMPWIRSDLGQFLSGPSEGGRKPALQTLHAAAVAVADAPTPGGAESQRDELAWACLPFVVASWDERSPREVFGRGGKSHGATPDREHETHSNGGVAIAATSSTRLVLETSKHTTRAAATWFDLAEDLVLITLLGKLKLYAAPIRGLAAFLMLSPTIFLLAITLYPFQPQRLLSMIVWSLVLAALGLAGWVFVQIDRDPFVSRVSRTTPNVANFDLALSTKLLPMLVPVIGLILAAFPNITFWLRGLLEPFAQALK